MAGGRGVFQDSQAGLTGTPGTVEVFAAEPARMGKIGPEFVAAVFREHTAAAVFITADTHFPFTGFLDWIPYAVTVAGAAVDSADCAVVAGVAALRVLALVVTASHS